ncbi:Deoxyhypusine synthase [Spraguea lophii 42_110]|uniref:deoxyhypusine synthase n=1 Tax=Spraguea lophii (strain 42_110) TaxID=1358809 RepID=S7WEC4_SPRLO|nr:Deoxyhypusine synthase [Spraguea lophii 42_110]
MTKKCVNDLAAKIKDDIKLEGIIEFPDFENNLTYEEIFQNYKNIGFQATDFYYAIQKIKNMKGKTVLAFTSNIISSGLQNIIKYLVKNKKIDMIITTGGGIEEDMMKSFNEKFYNCSWNENGKEMRENGLNRVGNIIIPNEAYVNLEKFINKKLEELTMNYTETNPLVLAPSVFLKLISKDLGEGSYLYWAQKNNIPIFPIGVVDGSIGDIITFSKHRNKLKLDIVEDIRLFYAHKIDSGIVLGDGLVKNRVLNAVENKGNCVVITTKEKYDSSDPDPSIDEATDEKVTKVIGDVSLLLPIIVKQCFI